MGCPRNLKEKREIQKLILLLTIFTSILLVLRAGDSYGHAPFSKKLEVANILSQQNQKSIMKDDVGVRNIIAKTESSIVNDNQMIPDSKQVDRVYDPVALESIRQDCGPLCDTSRQGTPGIFFDHVKAPVDCTALFKNEHIDKGHGLPHAPKEIPKELLKEYTMDNRVPITKFYFDRKYLGTKSRTPVWTVKMVENMTALAKKGKLVGTYTIGETNALRDGLQHAPGIENGRVLVIGSENPWVEACVLEAGAREVWTLEYGSIKSEHPKLKTIVPYDFRMMYLNNTLGTFDAIVTFSSVEHSGLGRYGDALNPWGDIIAIARAWCVTKKGGSLTIGVMYNYNRDSIRFNADRFYGKIRYPYLTTNWKQLYKGSGIQKVHVFLKEL